MHGVRDLVISQRSLLAIQGFKSMDLHPPSSCDDPATDGGLASRGARSLHCLEFCYHDGQPLLEGLKLLQNVGEWRPAKSTRRSGDVQTFCLVPRHGGARTLRRKKTSRTGTSRLVLVEQAPHLPLLVIHVLEALRSARGLAVGRLCMVLGGSISWFCSNSQV